MGLTPMYPNEALTAPAMQAVFLVPTTQWGALLEWTAFCVLLAVIHVHFITCVSITCVSMIRGSLSVRMEGGQRVL